MARSRSMVGPGLGVAWIAAHGGSTGRARPSVAPGRRAGRWRGPVRRRPVRTPSPAVGPRELGRRCGAVRPQGRSGSGSGLGGVRPDRWGRAVRSSCSTWPATGARSASSITTTRDPVEVEGLARAVDERRSVAQDQKPVVARVRLGAAERPWSRSSRRPAADTELLLPGGQGDRSGVPCRDQEVEPVAADARRSRGPRWSASHNAKNSLLTTARPGAERTSGQGVARASGREAGGCRGPSRPAPRTSAPRRAGRRGDRGK